MKKIINVVGARPQIIKSSAISRVIAEKYSDEFQEVILHTGQHYDENMSAVFFRELGIPQPHHQMKVGGGSHAEQLAMMITGMDDIIQKEQPDVMLVYGDTNSTLAASIIASRHFLPIVHVEAGLRSYNKRMPEEVNRITCDHLSTMLFVPTKQGIDNLRREGFDVDYAGPYSADHPLVSLCGDVMYDNSLYFADRAESHVEVFQKHHLKSGNFVLLTVHRDFNTDHPECMSGILHGVMDFIEKHNMPVLFPIHPRTQKNLALEVYSELKKRMDAEPRLLLVPPVSFLEMTALEKHCRMVLTDSGGVQKEAYYFGKPCLILRPETEWVELLEVGAALLAGHHREKIVAQAELLLQTNMAAMPALYGDGKAAVSICAQILRHLA
jgi:UDP-GlcNAc3NAcA epimerase